jgi:PKD repeat protein
VTILARLFSQLTFPRLPRRLALTGGLAATLGAALLAAAPAGAFISGNYGLQRRIPATVTKTPLEYHGGPVLHSSDAYVVYWNPVGTAYKPEWERLIDEYFQNVGDESGNLGDVFAVDTQYTDGTGRASNQTTFRGAYTDKDPFPASGCTEPSLHACLTDGQIQAELRRVITSVDPPLPGVSGTPVYYLLTPPGVTVCAEGTNPSTCSNSTVLDEEVTNHHEARSGICGYHSAIELGGPSAIPYVVQPWIAGEAGTVISWQPLETTKPGIETEACQNGSLLVEPNQFNGLNPEGGYTAGLADVLINDLSIEQQDVVVDPFLTGWYQTATDAEQGDMCQFNFGPPPESPPTPNPQTHAASESDEKINGASYYIAWAFDSADLTSGKGLTCWGDNTLEPHFTVPNPVAAGDIVGFNASESYITLDGATELPADEPYSPVLYKWEFGDGTTVSGANDGSEFHSYQYGGVYTVTLTVTDSGGNVRSTTRAITVVGPPAPSTGTGTSAGGTAPIGTATTGGSGAPGSSPAIVVPAPVATAAIVRQTLKTALRKGLVVSYSVNEQVAGHFEVLLSSAIAHRLGVTGTPATGLPAGSPAELEIAKAILVTTKGGHNALHIEFSKRTAAHLAHVHKLSLMLRLVVRNAATSPVSTTVLSTITLNG